MSYLRSALWVTLATIASAEAQVPVFGPDPNGEAVVAAPPPGSRPALVNELNYLGRAAPDTPVVMVLQFEQPKSAAGLVEWGQRQAVLALSARMDPPPATVNGAENAGFEMTISLTDGDFQRQIEQQECKARANAAYTALRTQRDPVSIAFSGSQQSLASVTSATLRAEDALALQKSSGAGEIRASYLVAVLTQGMLERVPPPLLAAPGVAVPAGCEGYLFAPPFHLRSPDGTYSRSLPQPRANDGALIVDSARRLQLLAREEPDRYVMVLLQFSTSLKLEDLAVLMEQRDLAHVHGSLVRAEGGSTSGLGFMLSRGQEPLAAQITRLRCMQKQLNANVVDLRSGAAVGLFEETPIVEAVMHAAAAQRLAEGADPRVAKVSLISSGDTGNLNERFNHLAKSQRSNAPAVCSES